MRLQFTLTTLLAIALSACSYNTTEPPATSAATSAAEAIAPASADNLCLAFGPQTPRDISAKTGTNPTQFALAPETHHMNLCNIHTHTNAEHKGAGFSIYAGDGVNGGYKCNETASLTDAELADPAGGKGAFKGAAPGDTIEVHWVHTSCHTSPGEGLGSCLSDVCTDPVLRVEAQAFLVVNDPDALDFNDFAYGGTIIDGHHQPKALPTGTGTPVVFRGSTTGPSYTQSTCSPLEVTWAVRPNCARLDIGSLHKWAASGNVFNETKSHGVRQLVTAPQLLSEID